MTKPLPKQTVKKMVRIIRNTIALNNIKEPALVAMLKPGHGIPLGYTCGAVLDHDMVRIESFAMGWGKVNGRVTSEDNPGVPRPVSIALGDIVWIAPEVKEVK